MNRPSVHVEARSGAEACSSDQVATSGNWLGAIVLVTTVFLVAIGPTRVAVPLLGSPYVGLAALLAGGGLIFARDFLSRGVRIPTLLLLGLAAVTVPLVIHPQSVPLGLTVLVIVPLFTLLIAQNVSGRALVVAVLLASIPILLATTTQIANPKSFLTSPYREGDQGVSYVADQAYVRVSSTFPSPAAAAAGLAAMTAMLWSGLRAGGVPRWMKVLARVDMLILVAGGVATFSRAALGALFLVGGFAVIARSGARRRWPYFVILVGVVAAVSGPLSGGYSDRSDLSERLNIAAHAIRIGLDHPIFGIGYGRLPEVLTIDPLGQVYHAHVMPAHYFVELGIFGLVGLCCIAVSLVQTARGSTVAVLVLAGAGVFAFLDVGVFLYPRSAVLVWLAIFASQRVPPRKPATRHG